MSGSNSFRMGQAPHKAEDEVLSVFDGGTINADFVEAWEFAEDTMSNISKNRIVPVVGQNVLKINNNPQTIRESVEEYNDRLPGSGQ